jgi:hypothetical protein
MVRRNWRRVSLKIDSRSKSMNTPTIEFQALHFPLKAPAALTEQPIANLNELSGADLEEMWLDAAQERAAQLDANPSLAIPVGKSLARMRAYLDTLP